MFFFQLEISINVLVSCSRFVWIPILWIYSHYTFLIFPVRVSTLDIRTSEVGPRTERVSAYPL